MRKMIVMFVALFAFVSCQNPTEVIKYVDREVIKEVPVIVEKPVEVEVSPFEVELRAFNAGQVAFLPMRGGDQTVVTGFKSVTIIAFKTFYADQIGLYASSPNSKGVPIYAEIWINGKLAASARNNGDTTSATIVINQWRSYVIDNPVQLIQDSFY